MSRGRLELRTGFVDLDTLLGGLTAPSLLVFASRPSHGKTSLALNIARNVAVGQGANVAIFSLEMSEAQLSLRLLASECGVESARLGLGEHNESEEQRIMNAMGVLAEADIHMARFPVRPIGDLAEQVRKLHSERPLELIVFDYVELIPPGEVDVESDSVAPEHVIRSLRELSRELGVVVIACAQLSRAAEERVPHVPMLSDLRESIEEDADVIVFVYREDMYVTQDEWQRIHPSEHYPECIAQIIVAKQRHGPTGTVTLRYRSNLTRFEDCRAVEPVE